MKGNVLLRLLFGTVGIVVGTGLAVWVVLLVGGRTTTVRVPDLAGLDVVRAAAALDKAGLVARLQDGVFSSEVETGLVARQRPAPGFQLKRGATVLVYPSLGRAVKPMPDLTGLTEALAETELSNDGMRLDRRCEVSGQGEAGQIIAQWPAAKAQVAPDTAASVLVNRAPRLPRYVMPDFVGVNEADATRVIRALGFQVGEVQRVPYPGAASGLVLRQEPAPGGPIDQGANVTLWACR